MASKALSHAGLNEKKIRDLSEGICDDPDGGGES